VETTTQKRMMAATAAAASELVNIGPEERLRRDRAGTVMGYLTVLMAAYGAVVLDTGDLAGHVARFILVLVPLFLAIGYKRSAANGACDSCVRVCVGVCYWGERPPWVVNVALRCSSSCNLPLFRNTHKNYYHKTTRPMKRRPGGAMGRGRDRPNPSG
jgi:hypothetical protein